MIFNLTNISLAYALGFTTLSSIVIFLAIWFLMNAFYFKASARWPLINRFVDKIKLKGNCSLVRRYGLVGMALLMAIPLPTVGVYSGTVLSWMMGMKWWSSMIAVVSGVTVSNSIVLLSAFGVIKATGLF
jgi:uncharacterized membrane protein